ncbi:hypothetical protein ACFOOK_01585 [Micromonospora krabiensis]|uniref:Asp23 family, cell envelope-related function n=1 Tax=Micromonospora krabiensis TaxID=307121 RepID=A0A1C3MX72_9ACTN|nr:hypothetical protein [Micromonospora krabiensis]SBV24927.1 hypothetical protein GA0070620_0392 [Micromonospora krabiensis]
MASGQPVAVVEGVDVDAVAAAVCACPAVVGLVALDGRGTYLPGRRVDGVVVDADAVVVQVRARWGAHVPELAAQVRAAVAPLVAGRQIDVVLADVGDPPDGDGQRPDVG